MMVPTRLLSILLLVALSNTALGVAVVCEDTSAREGNDVQGAHVVWDYHDYWYSGIYKVSQGV
jgi:hypothetical protein